VHVLPNQVAGIPGAIGKVILEGGEGIGNRASMIGRRWETVDRSRKAEASLK